jgi:hypothetical protein
MQRQFYQLIFKVPVSGKFCSNYFHATCLLFACVVCLALKAGAQNASLLLSNYHHAGNNAAKEKAAKAIVKAEIPFDSVYISLQKGRNYSGQVSRGFLKWDRHTKEGIHLFALVLIPWNYTPEKKWPVRVILHGDISHMDSYNVFRFIDTTQAAYRSVQEIRVYPSGYFAARWYYKIQYENVMQLLDSIKQLYNVDENLVSLGGFSDGGTGTYAFANYDVTPFNCYLPYIGSCGSLRVLGIKQAYFNNYRNRPFFIENGKLDETFPPSVIMPYVEQIMRLNNEVSFFMIDTSGHSLKWIPQLKDSIDHFVLSHPRNPHPDYIVWQTEHHTIFNRNHWVLITGIGKTGSNAPELIDYNEVVINGQYRQAFRRDSLAGHMEAAVTGNTITVRTKNITSYKLLLSPEQFDFSKPCTIVTNGILSFEGLLDKEVSVLLKWNSLDNDRTMLYGAEMNIQVGKIFKSH